MDIRALTAQDTDLHRALRLRALADSPQAFGETAAQARARPDAYWEALTRAMTEPGGDTMIVAIDGGEAVGSVYVTRMRERADEARLGGLWVAPERRRSGVGIALVEHAIGRAEDIGARTLVLWAPRRSKAAVALYRRAGFALTGRMEAFPNDPTLLAVEMTRALVERR